MKLLLGGVGDGGGIFTLFRLLSAHLWHSVKKEKAEVSAVVKVEMVKSVKRSVANMARHDHYHDIVRDYDDYKRKTLSDL